MVSLTNGSFDLGILGGEAASRFSPLKFGLLLGGTLHQLAAHELVALGLIQHVSSRRRFRYCTQLLQHAHHGLPHLLRYGRLSR